MKKRIFALILLCILVFAIAAWADNAARIKELQQRQQAIILEIGERQDIINAQNQTINDLRSEYLKAQGAIEELVRQDEEATKKNTSSKEKE